jgi:hypothetical protein
MTGEDCERNSIVEPPDAHILVVGARRKKAVVTGHGQINDVTNVAAKGAQQYSVSRNPYFYKLIVRTRDVAQTCAVKD